MTAAADVRRATPTARDPAAIDESTPIGRVLLSLLGALCAFGPLSFDMYLPAFPQIAADLGVSDAPVQFTLTACMLGLAGGQLIAGPLSDRFGRRRPLLIGVALYVVASLLCAIAPSIASLTALRFVQGLGGSAGVVIARAIVRDMSSGAEAARRFASMAAIHGIAPIIAPLIGAGVLAAWNWRVVFLVLALMGAGLWIAAHQLVPETNGAHRRGPSIGLGAAARVLVRDRQFVTSAAVSSCVSGALFAYIAGSPFVLQREYGLSASAYSVVFAANAVGIVLSSHACRRLVRDYGPSAVLRAGVFLCAGGAVAFLSAVAAGAPLPVVLACLFFVVISVALVHPNATALALARHAGIAGSASAVLGVSGFAVGAAAGPVVGAGSGGALPLAVVIATSAAGGLIALRAQRAHRAVTT